MNENFSIRQAVSEELKKYADKETEKSVWAFLIFLFWYGLIFYLIYVVIRHLYKWFQYTFIYKYKTVLPHSKLCFISLQFNCISCFVHQGRSFFPQVKAWANRMAKYFLKVVDVAMVEFVKIIRESKVRQLQYTKVDYSKFDELVQKYSDVCNTLKSMGYKIDPIAVKVIFFNYRDRPVDEIVQKIITI